ncbi:MAG: 16S rRNA (adenine(1518)-N(6)/adenine(1519)-N(6))-dimethyltransferase RsmA [Candidatus Saccharimonadales bacterium]
MNTPKAKKELGQHWLFDDAILKSIADAAELTPENTALEVGPGLGTLTKYLVKTAGQVVAVEADTELAGDLRGRVPAENLQVVSEDIMEYNFRQLPAAYKVVANIPYYLTSGLLRLLVENPNPPSLMVLLVQKEVAERVVAEPGQMSVLAFSIQYYAKVEIVGDVPKEKFTPEPKVDSAILKINMRKKPAFKADTKKLFRLVKAGFGERRKQLKNSLSGGLHISGEEAESLLKNAGINPQARAQELTMREWQALYQIYCSTPTSG